MNLLSPSVAICKAVGLDPSCTETITICAGHEGVQVSAVLFIKDEQGKILEKVLKNYRLEEVHNETAPGSD